MTEHTLSTAKGLTWSFRTSRSATLPGRLRRVFSCAPLKREEIFGAFAFRGPFPGPFEARTAARVLRDVLRGAHLPADLRAVCRIICLVPAICSAGAVSSGGGLSGVPGMEESGDYGR